MKTTLIFYILTSLWFQYTSAQAPPEARNDSYRTSVNTALNINASKGLLSNDTDPNGASLSITGFIINGKKYSPGQSINISGGNITINANGSFNYTPNPDFNSSERLIVYIVSNGTRSSFANLFLTIKSEGPPRARNDFDTVDKNTTLSISAPGVLSNDSYKRQDSISVTSVKIGVLTYDAGMTATTKAGDFTLSANGSYTFKPASGYIGKVPEIIYTISDGINSSSARLNMTVENVDNLIKFKGLSSCNQGFTKDGYYKINFTTGFRNTSTSRDYHTSSMINAIQITKELETVYGVGCIIAVEDFYIENDLPQDFVGNPYPNNFVGASLNPGFISSTSANLFKDNSFENTILYPRQDITIGFCLIIDPFCDGRPNPTPSGSGIDFEATASLSSSSGEGFSTRLLSDMHTTEAIITAGLYIPDNTPAVNPDASYEYTNSVIITNEGTSVAENVNFNLGLGDFLDNGLIFSTISVSQISGPPVNVNTNYDGDLDTKLLLPNNNLAPGDTIVLDVYHFLDPVGFTGSNRFAPINSSQTQGPLDGFDEDTPENRRLHSYVIWEDNLGKHLDTYYITNSASQPAINNQCSCESESMSFSFISSVSSDKTITDIEIAPNGILEHEEITFLLTITNTSPFIGLRNIQLQDDLSIICDNSLISFTTPKIVLSSAAEDPLINTNYNGVDDIKIFDGSSGFLNAGESVSVEITVVLNDSCVGKNSLTFSSSDPMGGLEVSRSSVGVDTTTDSDNDGIPNFIDIDDDNDTIPDIEESNGLDPLGDHDGDFLPNYRDTDFGLDKNNDGIVDVFDFDGDGVPNHLDLDSDNDGILDIYEAGNQNNDTDNDGRTNIAVGENGLDNSVETNDTPIAKITYTIPNSDADTNLNYLDIDADGDGIVDNVEAQTTDNYILPSGIVDEFNGIDSAYPNGLIPIDTDSDGIPDYIDTNSDNDIREDYIEGWDLDSDGLPETIASGTDSDNDGLDDAYDSDSSQINPTNGKLPIDYPNADYNVTTERDWREIMAIVVIIDDEVAEEGNSIPFTVSLVRYIDNSIPIQSTTPIDLILFTKDGSLTAGEFNIAKSPFDYNTIEDVNLIIPPLTYSTNFSINTHEDNISELDELFTLTADITSSNTINTEATGTGTILDNERLPSIRMNDDVVYEGEDLVYNINLSNPSSTPVEISVGSFDNTATAPIDYTPINTILTIDGTVDPSSPNISSNFIIETNKDNLNEPEAELLDVLGNVFSNNVNNPILNHTGTILDTDPIPMAVISNDEVMEGNTLVFRIRLLNEQGEPMGSYLPVDFEVRTIDVTTTRNRDFNNVTKFDAIPAMKSSLIIKVPTMNDNLNEEEETMNLSATVISGVVANPSSELVGIGTLKDDDIPNLFSPNNDGQSDVFRIGSLDAFPNFKLIIFDRWGGEIYNYSNNGNLNPKWWDGTKNGNPVIEGVYFYELDYNDSLKKPKTGFIQLVR